MLNVDTVYGFLIDHDLIDPASVTLGDLEITSSTRRNRNIIVRSAQRSLLIKQSEAESHSVETVQREIRFYDRFGRGASPVLGETMPSVVYADASRNLLVLRLIEPSTHLWRLYETFGADDFPTHASYALGATLARIHAELARAEAFASAASAELPTVPPPSLALAFPPPSSRATMSRGALELTRRMQAEAGLMALLAALSAAWETNAVIHGDIKLDNILVTGGDGDPRIHIVDWEMAQLGDVAWDIGSALRDFIFFWIISMPSDLPPDEGAQNARFPLRTLQPAIASFWAGYVRAGRVAARDAEALLARSMRFSIARIIQTALDMAGGFPEVPVPADLLLRVGVNLASDVDRGRVALYGIAES